MMSNSKSLATNIVVTSTLLCPCFLVYLFVCLSTRGYLRNLWTDFTSYIQINAVSCRRHWPWHVSEGLLCHGEDVWVHGGHVLPTVRTDRVIVVDRQLFVRVNCDQHNTWTNNKGLIMSSRSANRKKNVHSRIKYGTLHAKNCTRSIESIHLIFCQLRALG